MLASLPLPRLDVLRGGRALAALLRDPDDLPQVFTLIDSMSGTAPARLVLGFRRSEDGRRLLRERPDIVSRLADREGLRALPAGSLGREYLAFVESEGITPEGIRAASETERSFSSPEVEYIRCRMRDTHDLWHAVAGYKGDVLGELALLAFLLGQHWNSAVAAIVVAALLKGFGRTDTRLVWEGYLRGRRAAWLPAQEWERLLALPIDAVRARLEVGPPPEYAPLRTTELRAAGMVG
jgi:ubiquinone biosynthesis protein COQ4